MSRPTALSVDLLRFQDDLKLKKEAGTVFIFDPVRQRFMVQTPEELVRQLTVQYLVQVLGWPLKLIAVEKMLWVNERRKRFDILCFLPDGEPIVLIECKSPKVPVSTATFEQASIYNLSLKLPYLLVTNGISTYCCQVDLEVGSYEFLTKVPAFAELSF